MYSHVACDVIKERTLYLLKPSSLIWHLMPYLFLFYRNFDWRPLRIQNGQLHTYCFSYILYFVYVRSKSPGESMEAYLSLHCSSMDQNLMRWLIKISLYQLFACWLIFHTFAVVCRVFFIINFFKKKTFRNTTRVSNCLDPDQDRQNVGADLGSNCL